mgnify:CR=1 FL=1
MWQPLYPMYGGAVSLPVLPAVFTIAGGARVQREAVLEHVDALFTRLKEDSHSKADGWVSELHAIFAEVTPITMPAVVREILRTLSPRRACVFVCLCLCGDGDADGYHPTIAWLQLGRVCAVAAQTADNLIDFGAATPLASLAWLLFRLKGPVPQPARHLFTSDAPSCPEDEVVFNALHADGVTMEFSLRRSDVKILASRRALRQAVLRILDALVAARTPTLYSPVSCPPPASPPPTMPDTLTPCSDTSAALTAPPDRFDCGAPHPCRLKQRPSMCLLLVKSVACVTLVAVLFGRARCATRMQARSVVGTSLQFFLTLSGATGLYVAAQHC